MEELTGGRDNAIYRDGDTVIRPLNEWSGTIHKLLIHLRNQGVSECPRFLGVRDGTERLSFVKGDTFNYPLTGAIATETALVSAARLLRKLHQASSSFLSLNQDKELMWMLPVRHPQEVICHGDFTPYNVALDGERVAGVFDFDTAHPGPALWDLAYSVYCWAPFKTNPDDSIGTLTEQIQRAGIFCSAYKATDEQKERLVESMISRLTALVDFMQDEAAKGNRQFIDNIEQGHHLAYMSDIDYLSQNRRIITQGLF